MDKTPGKTLALVSTQSTAPTPQAQTRKTLHFERKPQREWVVTARNEYGRMEYFLRIEVTGLYPRRHGPFPSRHAALAHLKTVLRLVIEDVEETSHDVSRLAVVEDELAGHYRRTDGTRRPPVPKKGRVTQWA